MPATAFLVQQPGESADQGVLKLEIIRSLFLRVFLGGLLLCAAPLALQADTTNADDEQPLFYPMPPNQPRLQYLAKFSSVQDVSTKSSRFRNFVFGGEDKEGHLVEKPYGLATFQGAIYVVDTRGNGYAVFDIANGRSSFVRPTGAGTLSKPINIVIDTDGTRYLSDTGRNQVLVFDARERFQRAYGIEGQFRPAGLAIAGNRLYVSDVLNHQVHVLDKLSGDVLFSFGEAGSEPGQFFHPTNLAVAGDGSIYVSDQSNFRLQQFSKDGELIRVIGQAGAVPGKFARPKGIAIDKDDRIYVVDSAFQNVQILAPEGGALMYFGGPGDDRGNMYLPTVVKVDYESVPYFEKYAAPGFDIEYLVLVANQFGQNKVLVFGFGSLQE